MHALQCTQQSEGAPILFSCVHLCFQLPVALSEERHVCSEISQGCSAVRLPYLRFINQMGLLSILSPSVFLFFLCCLVILAPLLFTLCSTPSTTSPLCSATCFSPLSAPFIVRVYFKFVTFPAQNPTKHLPDPGSCCTVEWWRIILPHKNNWPARLCGQSSYIRPFVQKER